MHKYNKLFFSVLIFLIACKGSKSPGDIIDQVQMTSLLTEIHIADGTMYNTMQLPDTLYKYGTDKYLVIFKKFHTDSAGFRRSFKYYSAHPDLLANIYEQITINLKQKSDSINKINQLQVQKDYKKRNDSLNNLPKTAPNHPVSPPQPALQNPKQNFNQRNPKRHVVPVP
jgi:hypothetical protein